MDIEVDLLRFSFPNSKLPDEKDGKDSDDEEEEGEDEAEEGGLGNCDNERE